MAEIAPELRLKAGHRIRFHHKRTHGGFICRNERDGANTHFPAGANDAGNFAAIGDKIFSIIFSQ